MARRAPKKKAAALKVVGGTDRPSRRNENAPKLPDGDIEPPDWLVGDGLEEWNRVLPHLRAAKVVRPAHVPMLAMYCHMWGEFVDAVRRRVSLPASHYQQLRTLAEAFYLTPGSQASGKGPAESTNRFAKHGKRPA